MVLLPENTPLLRENKLLMQWTKFRVDLCFSVDNAYLPVVLSLSHTHLLQQGKKTVDKRIHIVHQQSLIIISDRISFILFDLINLTQQWFRFAFFDAVVIVIVIVDVDLMIFISIWKRTVEYS